MKKGTNPVVRIVCAFAFGIALSQLSTLQLLIVIPSASALVLTFLYLHRHRSVRLRANLFGLLLLPALAAMGWATAHIYTMRPGNAVELLAGSEQSLDLVALEDERACKSGVKVMVECRGEVAGRLLLYLPRREKEDSAAGIQAFDRLEVRALIRPLDGQFPGYVSWLRHQGIFATAKAMDYKVVGKEASWLSPLVDLRRELKGEILSLMPERRMGGLAVAMLLGDRSGLDGELREDFSRAGLSHILAISGLHVGIVFIFLSKLLGFIVYAPSGARLRTLLVIGLLLVYMLLTGASPAVCRAVMMLSMMEGGKLIFRRSNSLNMLALSGLVQLMVNPMLLFNVGFQLSYSAVAGILVLGPRIEGQIGKSFPGLGRKVAGSLSVCLAAQLCTAPLVAIHFHQFPTYFLLSNMLLLPAVSLAVMLGFSGMMLIWIPGLGQVLFGMLDFLLSLIAWLSGRISGLPGAVVDNFSLSDLSFQIFLAMVLSLLGLLFRKELSNLLRSGKTWRAPRLSDLATTGGSGNGAVGLAAGAILIMATLMVS